MSPSRNLGRFTAPTGRHRFLMLALMGGLLLACGPVQAMPSAPEGVIETGVPSFAVLGPEALGLSSSPLDLNLLPDGRVLVASQRELAFGDGVRWETYRAADGQPSIFASVAVDAAGRLYAGIPGGFGRIVLNEQARWQFQMAMPLPPLPIPADTALVSVATLGDQWYWYGGNGTIVSWHPGQPARQAGSAGAIRRIFTLGQDVFVSDEGSGGLHRLKPDTTTESVSGAETLVSESVTCAVPYQSGELLVGSAGAGLKLFDGKVFRPFGSNGLLQTKHRITDICVVGDSYFAVAIDTVGIVFFDRDGHIVQVLGRALDHRLARVQRLQYAANGVLWALLNDGLARVEFPSVTSISNFEPLIDSGLTFAQPLRHAGVLWIFADGRAMRGLYDDDARLTGFTDNTPPGRYLFTLTEVDGRLFAGNEEGIYVYESAGWKLVLAGIVNARVGAARGEKGEYPYVARGEYGVIRQTGGKGGEYSVHRITAPDLGDSYNAKIDAQGTGWIELGVSRVGRIELRAGQPTLRIFGPEDGLTDGWLEAYVLDGIARFHLTSHVYRFDEAREKFVEDRELLDLVPELVDAVGRPILDGRRRLWYTINGAPHVVDLGADDNGRTVDIRSVGFAPTSYTQEDDGVIWMFAPRRLSRMDLRIAPPAPRPPQAFITSVQFISSDRQLFAPGPELGALAHDDNSLVIHFAAPTNPFADPVTFEVMLEGADNRWTSTGNVGTATFNRLKEGDYTFQVRPVTRGIIRGKEARLQFTVRPPWFRTPLAWTIYIGTGFGLLFAIIWLTSYLQRRENERLEKLVAARTGELHLTNSELSRQIGESTRKSSDLAASEERYRLLNSELEARVQRRTKELAETHQHLLEVSRQAGMAEVATGVLHNVGNVLNSVNVSATLLREKLESSETASLSRVAGLLRNRSDDLGAFLTTDPKGRLIPNLVIQLADHLAGENKLMQKESDQLASNVEHIKRIVAMQQSYARVSGVHEEVRLSDLLGDALQMHMVGFARHGIEVVRNYAKIPPVNVDKHKVMQIFVNLIQNAKIALEESGRSDGRIIIDIRPGGADSVRVSVTDNGVGITAENLTRIFSHGFTTRREGHGFGLHSGAIAAHEMGGSLSVTSDGTGLGATFILELPLTTKRKNL